MRHGVLEANHGGHAPLAVLKHDRLLTLVQTVRAAIGSEVRQPRQRFAQRDVLAERDSVQLVVASRQPHIGSHERSRIVLSHAVLARLRSMQPQDQRGVGPQTFGRERLANPLIAPGLGLHVRCQSCQLLVGHPRVGVEQGKRKHPLGPDDDIGLLFHRLSHQPQMRQKDFLGRRRGDSQRRQEVPLNECHARAGCERGLTPPDIAIRQRRAKHDEGRHDLNELSQRQPRRRDRPRRGMCQPEPNQPRMRHQQREGRRTHRDHKADAIRADQVADLDELQPAIL